MFKTFWNWFDSQRPEDLVTTNKDIMASMTADCKCCGTKLYLANAFIGEGDHVYCENCVEK